MTLVDNIVILGLILLFLGIIIVLLILLLIKKKKKKENTIPTRIQEAKQAIQEANGSNKAVKWKFSQKHSKHDNNRAIGSKEFEKVKENVSFNDNPGLISFDNMTALQLDTENNQDGHELTPGNKLVLNLDDDAVGYIETQENQTDREVSKFAIEFSRSNVLDLNSTKRLDMKGMEDSDSSDTDGAVDPENILKSLKQD